jgi:ABC-2 type transport system permease protein
VNAEITRQALRATRLTLAIWAASFADLIALYAVIWPSVRGNTSWRNLFDSLPQTDRALFTASGTIDLSTAGGYLGVELMGFMGPSLIAVYAITTGAAAIAGKEDRGGLEVTLSAPVSRLQVFTQRLAAMVIGITTLMIATGATLWSFSALLDMGLGLGAIASGTAALGIFGLFAGTTARSARGQDGAGGGPAACGPVSPLPGSGCGAASWCGGGFS